MQAVFCRERKILLAISLIKVLNDGNIFVNFLKILLANMLEHEVE